MELTCTLTQLKSLPTDGAFKKKKKNKEHEKERVNKSSQKKSSGKTFDVDSVCAVLSRIQPMVELKDW